MQPEDEVAHEAVVVLGELSDASRHVEDDDDVGRLAARVRARAARGPRRTGAVVAGDAVDARRPDGTVRREAVVDVVAQQVDRAVLGDLRQLGGQVDGDTRQQRRRTDDCVEFHVEVRHRVV